MKAIIPIVLALSGATLGVGAGLALKQQGPEAAMETHETGTDLTHATKSAGTNKAKNHEAKSSEMVEFVKLNNQFIIPVLKDGRVNSMVVISLTVEAPPGSREEIYAREPRLRGEFLQVMFDHANAGGFDGTFTTSNNLDALRTALRETGMHQLGDIVQDVLVTDIARQDL